MKKALVPGSFDPITVGHMNIIERAAKMFDEVYVTVFINPNKAPRFPHEKRVEMIEAACRNIPNIKVGMDRGMLADYCKVNDICAVVKGARNTEDFEYEKQMADFNRNRNPELDTVILFPDPTLDDISSTKLYGMIKSGESYEALVPNGALEILQKLI